jgi:hypothetical protein
MLHSKLDGAILGKLDGYTVGLGVVGVCVFGLHVIGIMVEGLEVVGFSVHLKVCALTL